MASGGTIKNLLHRVGYGNALQDPYDNGDGRGARNPEPSAPPLPPGAAPTYYGNPQAAPGGYYPTPPLGASGKGNGDGGGGYASGGAAGRSDPWVSGTVPLGRTSSLLTPAAGSPSPMVSGLLGRIAGLFGKHEEGRGGAGGGFAGGSPYSGAAASGATGYGGEGSSPVEGRRLMERVRDILLADATLFQVEGRTGRVKTLVEGDAVRLRLRQQVLPSPTAAATSYDSRHQPGVVQMQVGDFPVLDINPPGSEPLPFLRAGPGVFTFRCPPDVARMLLRYGAAATGGPAWPTAPLDSTQGNYGGGSEDAGRHHLSQDLHWPGAGGKPAGGGKSGSESGSDSGREGGGGAGGDDVYFCMTVSPTVCDSCSLDQLEGVFAAYTRLSRQLPPAAAAGGYRQAPAGAATYTAVPSEPSAPYLGAYPAAAPASGSDLLAFKAAAATAASGTEAVAVAPLTTVTMTAATAAWGVLASAATGHEGMSQLGGRVVGASRAAGQVMVAAAYALSYRIRVKADNTARRLARTTAAAGTDAAAGGYGTPYEEADAAIVPTDRYGRRSRRRGSSGRRAGRRGRAALLPVRVLVVGMWLLSRVAAAVVGLATEALAGAGALAAELVLFSGALLSRWLPPLAGGRRGTASRSTQTGPGGGGGAGSPQDPSLSASSTSVWGAVGTAMAVAATPGHIARTATGTALLVYGELHGALEEAARVVLSALADAASQLAAAAGGPDAEGLTRGSLEAVGYTLDAITGVRKVGLRAVAREYQRRQVSASLDTSTPPPPPTPSGSSSRRRHHHRYG